jgi:hypothetical protein
VAPAAAVELLLAGWMAGGGLDGGRECRSRRSRRAGCRSRRLRRPRQAGGQAGAVYNRLLIVVEIVAFFIIASGRGQ